MIKTAILLAAGRGTKLWPYGDTWAKAAIPVGNQPVIQWQLEALHACGCKRFLVVVGHLCSQVRAAAADRVDIEWIEQSRPTGTAEALRLAWRTPISEPVLVVYGDTLFTREDVEKLLHAYQKTKVPAALVQALGSRPSQDWLCANVQNGQIREILGHPRQATHRLCGLYVLPPDFLPYLERNPGLMTSVEVGNMPPLEAECAESISRYLREGHPVQAVEAGEYFADLDKPWQLLDANTLFLKYRFASLTSNQVAPTAAVSPQAEIEGKIIVGNNSIIGPDVKIKGSAIIGNNTHLVDGPLIGDQTIIGDECSIREYCKIEPGSAIGNRCVVGHAAEFGGIMMEGAYSYHYGEYWGILGRSSDLGAATVCGTLRFDDQNTQHRIKGRRDHPGTNSANASYLGDFVRTGVNVILMPGVKVGPYSVIGPGVILQEDLPNGSSIFVKQELIRSTWGPERYGW